MNRYLFVPVTFLILGILTSCSNPDPVDQRLWYQQPASHWKEALPLGNGRLGAMVYGLPEMEHIQLNEESLWAGEPTEPYPENVGAHYARFQELNLQRKFEEAMNYAEEHLAAYPTSFRSYEPLGDMFVRLQGHSQPTDYERSLDLSTGIHTVSYAIDGKRFVRETLISTAYDVVVHHVRSLDGAPLTSDLHFERPKDIQIRVQEDKTLLVEGQVYDDPEGYDDNPGGSGPGGKHMKFAAQIAILTPTGKVAAADTMLRVDNVTDFTIILSAATDYSLEKMTFDRTKNPLTIAGKTLQKARSVTYEEIRQQHITDHQSVYQRVNLNLTGGYIPDTIPTDIRLQKVREGATDNHLTQVFFQYGRYLLMGSSGGNARLPANLQGIWNEEMWAPWEADYHLNINLQMNYWPAEVTHLPETVQPLSNWMKGLAERGQNTAQKFIGSEGWVAHHATNPFGRSTPSGSAVRSQLTNGYSFPLAGAWMSITLWRHYVFQQDTTYLREEAYPILQGASRFILDLLKENEKGQLVTVPSYSPENEYINPETGQPARNTVGAAIDMQIIRDVFGACLEAEKVLGIHQLSDEIEAALPRLPPIKIGANGTIQEWNEDYEEVEKGHRHISHLYALYPSHQITPATPALFEAAQKTIKRRLEEGGGQTGWSRAWVVNFYARLLDGNAAHHHVQQLLAGQVSNNLFDIHPPDRFQIDGNFGVTAGIAEMLLQSEESSVIRLLPALPDAWDKGEVSGLIARGNFEVSMTWENGQLLRATITAPVGGKCKLVYQDESQSLNLSPGETYTFTR
ncbi:MAG: glycoside hydrolase family 95 protein [Phaeodactylibacter sp.]|uniref:glycoside hydrolase family 95 protein n=1 Tax=Phaeodactylibacter sp. TaxID=1940289 RepID=UPI0032EC47BD